MKSGLSGIEDEIGRPCQYQLLRHFFALFVCFWCCGQASAWQDTAIAVANAHTLTVLHDGKKERVRLYGIESPHMRQDSASKPGLSLRRWSPTKWWRLEPVALDRWGRTTDRFGQTVALVYVEGRICLNEELLLAGLAWVQRQSCTARMPGLA